MLRGFVAPTTPFFLAFLAIAVVQRTTDHPVVQVAVAPLNWVVLVAFIVLFQLQLGGFANAVS